MPMKKEHITFDDFSRMMLIAVNWDSQGRDERSQNISDYYTEYRGQREPDFLEWIKENLNEHEVNPESHDFWLDQRGIAILYLEQNIY